MQRKAFRKYGKTLFGVFSIGCLVAAVSAYFIAPPADLGVNLDDVPYYKFYGDKDKPFWPSRVETTDNRFANPKNIASAAECVKCHVKEFEEWASSLHAISGRDAIYDKVIDFNENFKKASNGPEQIRFCEGCHEPGEVTLGRTNRVPSVMPSDAETEGLTCIFCHAAVHADPVKGNGAITIAINKAKDSMSNAMIMASPRDHARAFGSKATNSLITKSDFCGACHTEKYDEEVSKAAGTIHVQTTFTEWKESWYAKQDVTCQDCHMNEDPVGFINKLKQGVVEKPDRHTHTFVGANYLQVETALGSNLFWLRGGIIPGLTGKRYMEIIEKQKILTHKFLKSAAELEVREASFGPDQDGKVKIAVKNTGAGHNLPTGVSDQKYMWLELDITDAAGKKIHHTGWFDGEKGVTDPDAVIWIERFWDENGKRITDHLTFNTANVDFSRPLVPPRGEDVVEYDIKLPEGMKGPLKVKAKLWYRVALQDLVTRVIRASIIIPPFLLTEIETEVALTRRAASK